MNIKHTTIPIIAATALLFTSCIISNDSPEVVNYVAVDDVMPDFEVSNEANGKFISPDDFEGKTSMVVLFNTGCPDCKREMAVFTAAWEELKDEEGYQAVGFARRQTWEQVRDYDLSNPDSEWHYGDITYYGDPDTEIFGKFANMKIPRLYVVDNTGTVQYMRIEHWKEDSDYITADQLVEIVKSVNSNQ